MKTFHELITETTPNDRPIIWLDMDGVIVDYQKGIRELTGGYDVAEWKARAKKMTNSKGQVPIEFSSNTLHKMMTEAGARFWADLSWTSDGKRLWNSIKGHNPYILSAYRKKHGDPKEFSKKGKLAWIRKNLRIPESQIFLVYRDQKKNYAAYQGKPTILIDDYVKNIAEFKAAGGMGIRHTSAASTLRQLKGLGF